MKVIIFFGHHKVGSTALQQFFARNSLELLRHGILYPAVEGEGLSRLLAQALGTPNPPEITPMNFREPHNALAFRMMASKTGKKTPAWHGALPAMPAMLNLLRHQAAVLQPRCIVLCSEVFSNFGAGHPDLIAKLQDLFPGADYELYAILRRPDEYIPSWFGQRLRFGNKMVPLSDLEAHANANSIHFNYQKMVQPWIEGFPGCPLHLRDYAEVLAAGGSVQDFIQQVGMTFPSHLDTKGTANAGLPRASFELLRRANHDLPPQEARLLREFFLRPPRALSLPANHEVEVFGAETRTALLERFAPVAAYLDQIQPGRTFFPDLDSAKTPKPLPLEQAHRQLLAQLSAADMASPALKTYLADLQANG